ncbi:MAG: Hsp20/alpha crystallin family protein [Campylobacterales bacterium]
MLVTRFDPFRELRALEKRILSAFPTISDENGPSNVSSFTPAVNTREGEYAYHIEVDLPGVSKEDIHVEVKDGLLTISGERRMKNEVTEKDYYKVESFYGKFQRSFTLPDNADVENITASSKDGVLEVVIPKIQEAKSETKKITVN